MIIFPAIDIKDGTCVRLIKGDFGTAHKVAEDPLLTAAGFKDAGAEWMHMVDLDGAKSGGGVGRDLILRVARESGLRVEVGGGIRDMASVRECLSGGAERVILGSAALENKALVKEAVEAFGDRIAVGIDARGGKVATRGWLETSEVCFTDFAREIEDKGVKYIIFTDIARDGTLEGPNYKELEELQKAVGCSITASGGIRDIGDIAQLRDMGLYGAICGKSLYSGTLGLYEAIRTGGEEK